MCGQSIPTVSVQKLVDGGWNGNEKEDWNVSLQQVFDCSCHLLSFVSSPLPSSSNNFWSYGQIFHRCRICFGQEISSQQSCDYIRHIGHNIWHLWGNSWEVAWRWKLDKWYSSCFLAHCNYWTDSSLSTPMSSWDMPTWSLGSKLSPLLTFIYGWVKVSWDRGSDWQGYGNTSGLGSKGNKGLNILSCI